MSYEVRESKSNIHDERNVIESDDSYKNNISPQKRKLLEASSEEDERYYDNNSRAGGDDDVTSAVNVDDHSPIGGDDLFSDDFVIRKVNFKTKHDDTDFTNRPGGVFNGYQNAGTIYPNGKVDDDAEDMYHGEDGDVSAEQDYVTNDSNDTEDTQENATDRLVPSEQRLVSDLMWNYERAVRPVANASATIHVDIDLTVTQIFDLVTISHLSITFR